MIEISCNCGKKAVAKATYVVTFPNGTVRTYNSEIEAKMAVSRSGGSYAKKG